jgi:hypothetical protein
MDGKNGTGREGKGKWDNNSVQTFGKTNKSHYWSGLVMTTHDTHNLLSQNFHLLLFFLPRNFVFCLCLLSLE